MSSSEFRFNLRMPQATKNRLDELRKRSGHSMNATILNALNEFILRHEPPIASTLLVTPNDGEDELADVHFRMPTDLYEDIMRYTDTHHLNVNELIIQFIEDYLEKGN